MFPFFGLTPEYKVNLHKSIFSLITFGKGGWNWNDLYFNIPVFLRNYYLVEMSKALEAEAKASTRAPDVKEGRVVPPPYVKPSK